MVERQPSWDKYEAVILLEGLLASMKGELTRSDAIKSGPSIVILAILWNM